MEDQYLFTMETKLYYWHLTNFVVFVFTSYNAEWEYIKH